MRYLLDTNICIYIAKRRPPEVASRFERLRPGEVGMSMITYGELLFGAEKSQHPTQAARRLARFVELVPVLGLPEDTPRQYGRIRAELERAGEIIQETSRAFEAYQKVIQSADEATEKSINNVGKIA